MPLAELGADKLGTEISVIEFVISLPAPKIKAPLALAVRLAKPTTLLPIPDELLLDVEDSILLKAPLIVAPKFLVAFAVPPL